MTSFDEYQDISARTAPADTHFGTACNLSMGLAGETGEVVDELKKVLFHGKQLDRDALVEELGDVLWYLSQLAALFDVPLSEVVALNIEKLRQRYPEGFAPHEEVAR